MSNNKTALVIIRHANPFGGGPDTGITEQGTMQTALDAGYITGGAATLHPSNMVIRNIAGTLNQILGNEVRGNEVSKPKVNFIISSNLVRTQQTVDKLIEYMGVSVKKSYRSRNLTEDGVGRDFGGDFRKAAEHTEDQLNIVVITGHHNTPFSFINGLNTNDTPNIELDGRSSLMNPKGSIPEGAGFVLVFNTNIDKGSVIRFVENVAAGAKPDFGIVESVLSVNPMDIMQTSLERVTEIANLISGFTGTYLNKSSLSYIEHPGSGEGLFYNYGFSRNSINDLLALDSFATNDQAAGHLQVRAHLTLMSEIFNFISNDEKLNSLKTLELNGVSFTNYLAGLGIEEEKFNQMVRSIKDNSSFIENSFGILKIPEFKSKFNSFSDDLVLIAKEYALYKNTPCSKEALEIVGSRFSKFFPDISAVEKTDYQTAEDVFVSMLLELSDENKRNIFKENLGEDNKTKLDNIISFFKKNDISGEYHHFMKDPQKQLSKIPADIFLSDYTLSGLGLTMEALDIKVHPKLLQLFLTNDEGGFQEKQRNIHTFLSGLENAQERDEALLGLHNLKNVMVASQALVGDQVRLLHDVPLNLENLPEDKVKKLLSLEGEDADEKFSKIKEAGFSKAALKTHSWSDSFDVGRYITKFTRDNKDLFYVNTFQFCLRILPEQFIKSNLITSKEQFSECLNDILKALGVFNENL
ncbi:MAG TPA: hypothetical protein DIV86_04575, partial [Alphaproteobacteria bacterium]|nr:hypothetical protein [Alphaproteobacteria bacterium]